MTAPGVEPTPVSGAEVLAAAASAGSFYPEHDKRSAIMSEAEVLTRFVDWLNDHDMRIVRCRRDEMGTVLPSHQDQTIWDGEYEDLFAEFFGIDLRKIDAEQMAMLGQIRAANRDRET